jgi:2-desacetyl-2-hydroxyethyl bacteriochlorophyllide A dehydrogenase
MKALVYTANQEMTYRDEPPPQPEAGDALVAIESVGICGSDMHAYLGHDERRVPPLILGHEAVGTVLEGSSPGEKVVLNPLITCGLCDDCLAGRQNLCANRDLIGMYRAGAFAEQIVIPERNLIPVPSDMSPAKAALTEPGATGLHAVLLAEKVMARPISEARALVIGAGSVGLLTALILLDKGVNRVDLAETNVLRRKTVEEHTDCQVFDPIQSPPDTAGYDLVFDAVGSGITRQSSIASVRSGGVIVHIGLMDNKGEMDVRSMTLREITFIGTYTYTPVDLQRTLQKLYSGALGSLEWVEQRPLAQGARAFDELNNGLCAAPKIVLDI